MRKKEQNKQKRKGNLVNTCTLFYRKEINGLSKYQVVNIVGKSTQISPKSQQQSSANIKYF